MSDDHRVLVVASPPSGGGEVIATLLRVLGVPFAGPAAAALDRDLVAALGGSWPDAPSLPASWVTDPGLRRYRARAAGVVRDLPRPAAVWPGPGAPLLAAFWRSVLPGAATALALRSPTAVAGDLAAGGLDRETGARLWLEVTTAALRDDPATVIVPDDDPLPSLYRLAAVLRLPVPPAHHHHPAAHAPPPAPELPVADAGPALLSALRVHHALREDLANSPAGRVGDLAVEVDIDPLVRAEAR